MVLILCINLKFIVFIYIFLWINIVYNLRLVSYAIFLETFSIIIIIKMIDCYSLTVCLAHGGIVKSRNRITISMN
jgi:hypothetical protein